MDDPVLIGEAYISSISRQAGRDFALDRMAESGNPLVKEITGEIADALDARNAWLGTNPVTELIKAGYTKGQRLTPAKAKGDMPSSAFDDLFGVTKHEAATQEQRNVLMQEGKKYVEAVGADVSERRTTIVENLKALKSKLMSGLQTKITKAEGEIKKLNAVLEKTSDEIKKLGPLTSDNTDDFVALHVTLDNKVREIKGDIKKIHDRYGKKLNREQRAVERELVKTLKELDRQVKAIQGQYDKAATAMKKEALDRKQMLERDVCDAAGEAHRCRGQVEAQVGGTRPSQGSQRLHPY